MLCEIFLDQFSERSAIFTHRSVATIEATGIGEDCGRPLFGKPIIGTIAGLLMTIGAYAGGSQASGASFWASLKALGLPALVPCQR